MVISDIHLPYNIKMLKHIHGKCVSITHKAPSMYQRSKWVGRV